MTHVQKKARVVEVHWIDSTVISGWRDQENSEGCFKDLCGIIVSVGFLVYKDDNHIVIVQGISPFSYSDITKIPMECVKRIHYIKRPK